MADVVVTPGNQTSEHSTAQKALNIFLAAAAVAVAAGGALLGSGLLAEGGQIATIIGIVVTVLGAVVGALKTSTTYTTARAAVKSEALRAQAAQPGN